jgi:hypothetical protein
MILKRIIDDASGLGVMLYVQPRPNLFRGNYLLFQHLNRSTP